MKIINKLSRLVVLVLTSTSASVFADEGYAYEIITYPGADVTQAWTINNKGQVAAGSEVPFIYDTKSGGISEIPTPLGFSNLFIVHVTESGAMVGAAENQLTLRTVGVYIDKKGAITSFEHPDSAGFVQPRGMNSKGQIVGFYEDSATGAFNGFSYDSKKGEFITVVPSQFTIAQGVNSQGQIVGSATFSLENNPCPAGAFNEEFDRLGWVRNPDGEVIYFKVNDGLTSARGIAENGTIVGFVTLLPTFEIKGFMIPQPTSQCASITVEDEDFFVGPNEGNTFLQHITNSGNKVVGQYFDPVTNLTVGFVASDK